MLSLSLVTWGLAQVTLFWGLLSLSLLLLTTLRYRSDSRPERCDHSLRHWSHSQLTILKFAQFLLFLYVRVTGHDWFAYFRSVILFVPFLISLPNQGSRDLLKEVNPESLMPRGRSFLTQRCNFRGVGW